MQHSTFSKAYRDNSVRMKKRKNSESEDRRYKNRRRMKSDGYVHLPAVGWYCRRIRTRRQTDDL